MQNNQDPRNIFINQRQQYSEQQVDANAKTQNTQSTNKTTQQTNPQDEYNAKVEEMKRLAAKYEREGEGQLVKDIVTNVIEQKASGNLTNDQLIAFAKRVSPLLNAEQKQRLNGLLEELLKL
ncbi:MAG: hypothetical protein K2M64_00600 [Clostridia bacterium]|nr:hypothetical protein [Clostridia bacterium]